MLLAEWHGADYKTLLQQFTQQADGELPEYIEISESGPDHMKTFEVEARLNSNVIGHGVGHTKREAERMLRDAELEAKTKVSETEVLYAAKEKARQIIARAEERSRQLYQVANEYAEDALARTEEAVQAALDEVKQSRMQFRSASNAKMQEQRAKLEESTAKQNAAE